MTDNFNRKQSPQLTEQDAELLSAYLDGMLERDQRSTLEGRLAQDAFLRAELDALRQTVSWIQTLPELRAPRNFTLQPEVATRLTKPQILPTPRRSLRPVWTALASAAAVFVLFVGVLLVLDNSEDQLEPAAVAFAATPIPQMTQVVVQATVTPMPSSVGETVAQFSAPVAEQEEQTLLADSAPAQSADTAEAARTLESSAEQAPLAAGAAAEANTASAADQVMKARDTLEHLLVSLLRLALIILQGTMQR